MVQIYQNPPPEQWAELQQRSSIGNGNIDQRVRTIVDDVATRGDRAIRELTARIDGVELDVLELPEELNYEIDKTLVSAINIAATNIRTFHQAQRSPTVDIETMPGVRCVQRSVPISNVGLYIPGGTAPLFSTVLMLAITAQVAGCKNIILCSPPPISPVIIYTARQCGVKRIFQIGGAMAVAAMAYGTESVPKVDKIFGPGNQWVTTAKQIVSQSQVAIDMPAGPSEVMIMADHTARPEFVAADMLSQAEHGVDSQAITLCHSLDLAQRIAHDVEQQVSILSREAISRKSLENCKIIVLPAASQMVDFANGYAAEHLIISMEKPWTIADRITAAGSVFIGNYSPESVGDYASGTNHTLPTYGWAKSFSGVNLDSFMRKITYQELSEQGLGRIAQTVVAMSEAEGLTGHARAVTVRLKS